MAFWIVHYVELIAKPSNEKVNEYDQEMPQSHIAEQPTTERDTEH